MQMSVLSTAYVIVPVLATTTSGPEDPTGDPVEFAFKAAGADPGMSDWIGGSWVDGTLNGTYLAQCLVGPEGGAVLALGSYVVWTKITDDPEVPVLQAGVLTITP